jgi:acetolactate decarboxylase
MTLRALTLLILLTGITSCSTTRSYPDIKITGAMKDVMWNGQLEGKIDLDTISDRTGLYGLGPESYLTGEVLINNGKSYVSRVTSDTTMSVTRSFEVTAPFFVYAHVKKWKKVSLPSEVKTIKDLEQYLDKQTTNYKRPYVFKLKGRVKNAVIHIQNLPSGTKVSSPQEAHKGQVKYQLTEEESEIVGFFSTEHQGIFTHHDSYLHMHLLTKDERSMGHADALELGRMVLYLPVK